MVAVLDGAGAARRLAERADPARPLVVEVGCGRGEATIGFATEHPDVDIFAVDVHTPGVVAVVEAADAAGLPNVFTERADALHVLDERCAPGQLAAVHLFFPDPWPKARHHKRRFVRPDVLDLVADRLRRGGSLLMATDVEEYVRWALRHGDAHPAFTTAVAERPAWRPVTRYEAVAGRAGRPVVDLEFRRR